MNAASPQKANAKEQSRDIAVKTIFQVKERTGIRKTLCVASKCLKSSFTRTPTITPTSYPNKIYKNCCTPGKKAASQQSKYSTHYSKIFKRCTMAFWLVIPKVTKYTLKIIGAGMGETLILNNVRCSCYIKDLWRDIVFLLNGTKAAQGGRERGIRRKLFSKN